MIRGLTLHRPWAWAIAHGTKRIENRQWEPPNWMLGEYLAIHAGKKWDIEGAVTVAELHGLKWAHQLPPESVAEGIAAVAQLVGVKTESDDPWFSGPFGWELARIVPLDPIPCRGRQKLWHLPPDVLEQVRRQWLENRK
jgi:hypothetical protein